MTDLSELLQEAEWSLMEGKDAENALTCVRLAAAALGSLSTETSSKRKSKKTKQKSRKKKKASPPLPVTFKLVGKLPHGLSSTAFRAAMVPMLEDLVTGEIVYKGFNNMRNGTICYNFSGMCPIHAPRVHDGSAAIWQLKQHPKSEWCGFKCWKQDSYIKQFSNPSLCDF